MAQPIPPPPQYYSIDIRRLIIDSNLEELEKALKSFQIESKLFPELEGPVSDIYNYLENLKKKYINPKDIIAILRSKAHLSSITQLQESIMSEIWGETVKAYLFKTDLSDSENFVILIAYRPISNERWIAVYSSSINAYRAQYILISLEKRVLQKKLKAQLPTQTQLQKEGSISFSLNLAPREEIFVLDTNVLYENHNFSKFNFSKNKYAIVLTSTVFRELDRNKMTKEGNKARTILNTIDSISKNVSEYNKPILIQHGKIHLFNFVFDPDINMYAKGFDQSLEDDRLLMTSKVLSETNPQNPLTVISTDTNVRIKGRSIGLACLNYRFSK